MSRYLMIWACLGIFGGLVTGFTAFVWAGAVICAITFLFSLTEWLAKDDAPERE